MGRYYDKKKKYPSVNMARDLLILNRKNPITRRLSKMLDDKLYRPLQVDKVISLMAIRLTLPHS
jgi:hypothetical protein